MLWKPPFAVAVTGAVMAGRNTLTIDVTNAWRIRQRIKNSVNEHYDSISGRELGVHDYCMGSTLVTMMLAGLTHRDELKLRVGIPSS